MTFVVAPTWVDIYIGAVCVGGFPIEPEMTTTKLEALIREAILVPSES